MESPKGRTEQGEKAVVQKVPLTPHNVPLIIAGAITPAAGVPGAFCIGAVSPILYYLFAIKMKHKLGDDHSLDVHDVHGICGIIWAILTGVFCFEGMGGSDAYNDTISMGSHVWGQIVWNSAAAVIAKFTVGLRIDDRSEESRLDQTAHGESAYTDLPG